MLSNWLAALRGAGAGPVRFDVQSRLVSWREANPPELAVHRYSNLEIALRAAAWFEVLARAGDRLDPTVVSRKSAHMIEGSVSCHRFVQEMLAPYHLLGGREPWERDAMVAGAQFLARLGALDRSRVGW